jgi:CRISPR/Cas system-associated exonuclease Cas4 (RecB family)
MRYSRQDVLSLQFNAVTSLRKLTRAEFLTRLQVVRVLEPIVNEAFKISEDKVWREALDSSPHGQPWHVSFHASQFPGNNPMACPRAALYQMMDFPPANPISRKARQTSDSGKQTEVTLVQACDRAGLLLSSSDPYKQTGFEYPEAWLTGTVDAVLNPSVDRMFPVEIKERKDDVIQQMKRGRGPFDEHVRQIRAQIGLMRQAQPDWHGPPIDHGYLYYISRDNPVETAEFLVEHDEGFWIAGIETLKRWRVYFEEDMLPELDPGRRSSIHGHPHGWRWSYPPCAYCAFKRTCQLDFREGCTTLSDSSGIDRAKKVRPEYDMELARLRVRARWQEKQSPKSVRS